MQVVLPGVSGLAGASGHFLHQNPITGASGDSLRQNPINSGGEGPWGGLSTCHNFSDLNLKSCGSQPEYLGVSITAAAATFLKVHGSYSSGTTLQGQA